MKISKLTASLLTSTAVFAGVLVAQQGQSHTVSADSKLRVDYSSNLRQQAGTDANIIGGLKVGETYSYDRTATANGYTWYEIGTNKWVASAGTKVTGGQVTVTDASNKRVGPSTSHKIVGGYYPGQKLTFTETTQAGGYTWYKVGKNAWVASAGVTETGVTRVATQSSTTAAQPTTTTTSAAKTTAQATTPATSTTTATTTAPATSTASNTTASTATAAAKTTTPATTTTTTPTVTAASGKVQTTVASNVRSSADTSAKVTGSLPAGTIRNYTATSVADGYTWYQVGANQWVAGAKPYTGTASATTATSSTPSTTTSAQHAASQTQSAASTSNTTTQSSSSTAASYTSTTTSGTQTAKNSAGNTYAWGQCTWYVKSVAPWAGNYWGNGAQWGASAAAEGFTVNHTPSVGSIVVVAGGQNFGGWTAAAGYGHVAYVVGVNGNTITVQQGGMGFSNPAGPNTQTVSGASNFTYIHR